MKGCSFLVSPLDRADLDRTLGAHSLLPDAAVYGSTDRTLCGHLALHSPRYCSTGCVWHQSLEM